MTETKVKIGVIASTGIVAGNMMGSGIALLPANLASIGGVSLFAWFITTLGGLSLAYVFAKLAVSDPQSGGPIAYSGQLAPILGYQAGVLYYHSNWIGNLAICVTAVTYLSVFFPSLAGGVTADFAIIACVWLFAFLNLLGAGWISKLVTIGVVLILVPVILTGTVGWFWFSPEQYATNWNVTPDKSDGMAILSAILLCVWSFIGLESASVNASLVKDPKRTIPISTLLGTAIAAVVYILSTTVINGIFPAKEVAASSAPFSMVSAHMFGAWAAPVVSAVTAFTCLASLGSWMMLTAEAGARTANEGYLPKIYGERNKKGVASKGIILQAIQMTVLILVIMVVQGGESQGSKVFSILISIAGLLVLLPYFYSALNLLGRFGLKSHAVVQVSASLIACVFCLVALYGSRGSGMGTSLLVAVAVFIFYARWHDPATGETSLHVPKPSEHSLPDYNANELTNPTLQGEKTQ